VTTPLFDQMKPTKALTGQGFSGPVTYSIAPKLPDFLDFDGATGVVSGTPTTLETSTAFVITGTDGTFTATADLALTTTCPTVYTPQVLPPGCPEVAPAPEQAGGVSPMMLAAVAPVADPVHGPLTNATNSDTCALCHRTHSSKSPTMLGSAAVTASGLCFSCHNGTGSNG
jgi:predicted CXXCH cytochrome family protein